MESFSIESNESSKLISRRETKYSERSLISDISEQIIPVIYATATNLFEVIAYAAIFLPSVCGQTTELFIELLILTTVVSQLCFAAMSGFQAIIGTEMADNIPFFHTLALGIASSLGIYSDDDNSIYILPTVLVAM